MMTDCLSDFIEARSSQSPFFFFQAEDGIRDVAVTGVQTCALPIWFVIAWGNHASSAARLSYSIVSRTFGGSIPFRSEDPGQQRRRLSRRGRPPPARGPRDARRGDRRRA